MTQWLSCAGDAFYNHLKLVIIQVSERLVQLKQVY